eukprot:TRINITY_DN186_c0_g1_i1.p1 TRINITY_DN186_c0_g1~~TRINITY_DN186_c0_g1_i1.p1  ORF type:complete len:291 (+),score=36.89 TRINITY_DN186_c0_g1_i1:288-1160(+)
MGCGTSSIVKLHVYDLSNGKVRKWSQLAEALLDGPIQGIWHSGIVIGGLEYFYGGGVGVAYTRAGHSPYGKPDKVEVLGRTRKSRKEFNKFLKSILHKYTGGEYHLFKHNCNVFANECSMFLTGNPIPDYVLKQKDLIWRTALGRLLGPLIEGAYEAMWKGNQRMNARPLTAAVIDNDLPQGDGVVGAKKGKGMGTPYMIDARGSGATTGGLPSNRRRGRGRYDDDDGDDDSSSTSGGRPAKDKKKKSKGKGRASQYHSDSSDNMWDDDSTYEVSTAAATSTYGAASSSS